MRARLRATRGAASARAYPKLLTDNGPELRKCDLYYRSCTTSGRAGVTLGCVRRSVAVESPDRSFSEFVCALRVHWQSWPIAACRGRRRGQGTSPASPSHRNGRGRARRLAWSYGPSMVTRADPEAYVLCAGEQVHCAHLQAQDLCTGAHRQCPTDARALSFRAGVQGVKACLSLPIPGICGPASWPDHLGFGETKI